MGRRLSQTMIAVLGYLPTVMTIAFSAYVVLRNRMTRMTTDELLVWVLSILGLLATATLVERLGGIRRIEKFTEATHDYVVKHERKPSIGLVFADRKILAPLETRLHSAREIVVTGGSLVRLVSEYLGYLEEKARNGCSLKFLLVDPESEAARLLAKHVVYEVNSVETYRGQILTSVTNLNRLRQQYPGIIEIRTCSFVPPLGLLMTDPHKEHGIIQVELYTLAVPTRDRPEFTVQAEQDPYWFSFFRNQFDQMWSQSKAWDPRQGSLPEIQNGQTWESRA